MPNLSNFSVTEGAAVQVTLPGVVIEAEVYDDETPPNLVANYTGPTAIHFPDVLSALAPADRAQIYGMIAQTIVLRRAGY